MRKRPSSVQASLPSGSLAEHLIFGAMRDERGKLEEEKLREEEEKQKRKVHHHAEKSKKEGQKIRSSCEKQVMHYSFHAIAQHWATFK